MGFRPGGIYGVPGMVDIGTEYWPAPIPCRFAISSAFHAPGNRSTRFRENGAPPKSGRLEIRYVDLPNWRRRDRMRGIARVLEPIRPDSNPLTHGGRIG